MSEQNLLTSLSPNRKIRCTGEIMIITSFNCANLTAYVYRDNNKYLLALLSKTPSCKLKNTHKFCAVNHFLQSTLGQQTLYSPART
jgi:hypothetical protein